VDRSETADRELVRLFEEQAALRRVATLVARGADRLRVCATVTEEVGRLLGADVASMIRFEDGHGTVVAGWSSGPTPSMTVGYRVSFGKDSTAARIHETGLPARVDSYDVPGEAFATLRALGVRSSVGAPIVVDGELWGAVVVGSTSDAPFPFGAEQRLAGFAELVAQALANAEAREQLAASRKRLVEAAQLERRRLERNLHDGAQQRLVAIALTLRLAERQLEPEAAARDLLARASAELAEALEELRALARGLHPAVLTDHGLEPAVRTLAARAPLPVELNVDLEARPDGSIEAAAYFVIAEALTNVARYACASVASVTVRADADCVLVEVTDDGKGGADPLAGSGLRGLIDRVEALGGQVEVLSPIGRGTSVRACLPTG
jgi:signal transduction histidine kinase